MKTMYDAAVPQPSTAVRNFDVAAGYVGHYQATPHVWSAADWNSQPARYRFPIYVPSWFHTGTWTASADAIEAVKAFYTLGMPVGCATGLDFETQVNPSYVQEYVTALSKQGYFTLVYGSTSSLFKNPSGLGYWVANPTGQSHMYLDHPAVLATQWGQVQGNGLDYDVNVISDAVPLWDTATNGADDMTPEEHNWLANVYAGMFHGGSSCGVNTPSGSNSMFAHLDYITTLQQGVHPVNIDVAALAAALNPLLAAGATADQIATAVVAHLASTLAKG